LLADAEGRIGRLIFRKEILMATTVETKYPKIVKNYFSYVRELRAGKEEAVDKLMELWDADGVFEFAGAPPLVATFQGRNAIHVLYKNRLLANGMPLQLDFKNKNKAKVDVNVALGVVDTEVHRMREMNGNKMVAGWTTVIGTDRGQGFEVSGAHTFTFRDGKIRNIKVVISPQPAATANLSADELAVDDIGRLSLAAWAVV
jgi:hypothetical protein